ncbi:MAG: glycosyltransferase [bacterium]|nr:glycosyltransferase [bacterium]
MKISIVVATLNRDEDLKVLLESLLIQTKLPFEIIVVDQSDDDSTKDLCLSYSSKLPLNYIHSTHKSGTHSRNIGIQKSTGDVVAFLDDDTKLLPDYLEQIEIFYRKYPHAIGGMGKIVNFMEFRDRLFGRGLLPLLYKLAASFFGLNSFKKAFIILKSSRNIEYYDADHDIKVEWLSGLSWYRKEIFNEFKFEEKFEKWSFGEDRMLSYRIFKRYPASLYFCPNAKLYHFESGRNRLPEQDKIFMKVIYQYWFAYSCVEKNPFFYWWGNMGEILLHLLNASILRESFSNSWYYIKANLKLVCNLKRVKKGDLKNILTQVSHPPMGR